MKTPAQQPVRTLASAGELKVELPKRADIHHFKNTGTTLKKSKSRTFTYPVDMNDCGPMVLDALIKIKNEQDSH